MPINPLGVYGHFCLQSIQVFNVLNNSNITDSSEIQIYNGSLYGKSVLVQIVLIESHRQLSWWDFDYVYFAFLANSVLTSLSYSGRLVNSPALSRISRSKSNAVSSKTVSFFQVSCCL